MLKITVCVLFLFLVGGAWLHHTSTMAVADPLQLDSHDAALRALAFDMQRCGWRRENISAILKFYLPGGDAAIQRFWIRVDTDTHRAWFSCPESLYPQ